MIDAERLRAIDTMAQWYERRATVVRTLVRKVRHGQTLTDGELTLISEYERAYRGAEERA